MLKKFLKNLALYTGFVCAVAFLVFIFISLMTLAEAMFGFGGALVVLAFMAIVMASAIATFLD